MATVYARKESILEDMGKHEYYVAPSEKLRLKRKEAQKRARILEKKLAKFESRNRDK